LNNKEHYGKVARLGCMLCRVIFEIPDYPKYIDTPCEIHHIQKNGIPRNQRPVIPLCFEHHRGNSSIHQLGKHGFKNRYCIDEETLLAKTMELLIC